MSSASNTEAILSERAYHFTDTVRLPWIIGSGALRPDSNQIGGYPNDFLWATTDCNGDLTSAAMSPVGRKLWRSGDSQVIRFTLDASDFETFEKAARRCPEWTADHIARLKAAAAAMGESDTSKWRCRSQPLPLARVVRVEAKSYFAGQWVEIDALPERCTVSRTNSATRGFVIREYCYEATRELLPDGNVEYIDIVRRHVASAA